MALDLSTPCIPWHGYISHRGYGQLHDGREAHRVAFERANGPIPKGMHVGHLCHDADLSCSGGSSCVHRSCWNALHLALQTNAENQRGVWGRRGACVNGHDYDEANTYIRPNGRRDCRACIRDRVRRYKLKAAA